MTLSDHSLSWFRNAHGAVHSVDLNVLDLADTSFAVGLMAHATPAWTEPHVAVLDHLIERHVAANNQIDDGAVPMLLGIRSMIDTSVDRRRNRERSAIDVSLEVDPENAEQLAARWPAGSASRQVADERGLDAWERFCAAPLPPCPQVVEVDFPDMALDRAEWIDGNLHIGLAPRIEDATKATSFRVVGAEPRIWDLHGIENARMESRMSGLNVRVPMVKADVTLIRSSY